MSKRNRANSIDSQENKPKEKEHVLKNAKIMSMISKHLTMRDILPMQEINRQCYKQIVPQLLKNHRNRFKTLKLQHLINHDNQLSNLVIENH